MAACYSTETTDPRPLGEEEPLPEALRDIPHPMRVLCFFAVGRPDFKDHWKSMQSDQAFETVRTRLCSILANTITAAAVLIATSGVFVTTGSPVTYFDYSSPAPYFLLFVSLMLAMIAMLTSGLSMLRWLHIDRQWTREQLKPGGYFAISYLLSIVSPMFFLTLSLNCFVFAVLIAGFCSQSIIFCTVSALWLVMYIANIGMVSMEFMIDQRLRLSVVLVRGYWKAPLSCCGVNGLPKISSAQPRT
ncbi:hypothetical protein DEU56DRAFT_910270 [Suillus clintonianus]|uniref:uncharacterized protein n=1 Tax=Suillus clintonianus TaxID=1904413 RepID=UPI001B86E3EC|nr:uncharacterized protein DEU56DRAFT_910270 [Suillus clintonianus]KAG2145147.1 hypothetical protein DEU56DRAFT_910270 [Suillus clintonianus]